MYLFFHVSDYLFISVNPNTIHQHNILSRQEKRTGEGPARLTSEMGYYAPPFPLENGETAFSVCRCVAQMTSNVSEALGHEGRQI